MPSARRRRRGASWQRRREYSRARCCALARLCARLRPCWCRHSACRRRAAATRSWYVCALVRPLHAKLTRVLLCARSPSSSSRALARRKTEQRAGRLGVLSVCRQMMPSSVSDCASAEHREHGLLTPRRRGHRLARCRCVSFVPSDTEHADVDEREPATLSALEQCCNVLYVAQGSVVSLMSQRGGRGAHGPSRRAHARDLEPLHLLSLFPSDLCPLPAAALHSSPQTCRAPQRPPPVG